VPVAVISWMARFVRKTTPGSQLLQAFSMRPLSFLLLALPYMLRAAALVPLPSPKQPVSISEIQPNRGQGASGILFQTRGTISIAAQGSSLLFSPIGARQNFSAGNPNPQVSFFDPLPGVAHDYATANPQRWITNIPRYATARLAAVYPGVDVEYTLDPSGKLTLGLLLAVNANLDQVVFEVPDALIRTPITKTVIAQFIDRLGPLLTYGPLVSSIPVTFEQLSATTFRLSALARDTAAPLRIDMDVQLFVGLSSYIDFKSDAQSNFWAAVRVPDAAGKEDPFPSTTGDGCGISTGGPIACTDVAVYKLSAAGAVISVTYLSGNRSESPAFLGIAPDGTVVVTGNTNSSDFPVSTGVIQTAYAGPAAVAMASPGNAAGDYFALRLNLATGALRAATYFGGPNEDSLGETVLAADGSLYFLHKWLNADSTGLPTTPGALMRDCADTGSEPVRNLCLNAYVAHLSGNLDRLIFGTYVPGVTHATMRLHSDGSVYYSGSNSPSFQPTPSAYQTKINGAGDAIVARLDSTGSKLLFATYLGGPKFDWILRSAVAPDGSIWVHTSSFDQCCVNIEYHLIRIDAKGENKLVDLPIDIGDIATDRDGNVLATTVATFTPSSGALLSNPCPYYRLGYVKINATGQPLFFTYLPRTAYYDFYGTGPNGFPIVILDTVLPNITRFEIIENRNMGVFAGCMVDSANYISGDVVSPGEIVTIFGSQMGPAHGVSFSLENGHLPTSLGGTQVLVNTRPIPLLYVSASQINAILPFDLQPNGPLDAVVKVESVPTSSNKLPATHISIAGLFLFTLDGSGQRQAAAINEDGTVNSPQHPAKPGSRVMLFGTGGGHTNPPSTAGEVTPLEIRRLSNSSGILVNNTAVPIEFAGAAPGLVSGVNQINIKLPDPMPKIDGYPSGTLPLYPFSSNVTYYPGHVILSVTGN
jgi:uncharacterized protein (TIGR03437 family)